MDILIIDDNQSNVDLVAAIVTHLDHTPICADSGTEALTIVDAMPDMPDLVVLDINMPGIDGYETASRLKEKYPNEHLPVVFLTASKAENLVKKCLEIGDDYIAKPIDIEEVTAKINAHLRLTKLYKKLKQQNAGLNKARRSTENEHRIVENIFNNQFQQHITQVDNIRSHLSPMSVFNGDVLLTAKGPTGNLYITVGDVTGHGLPAAVGAMPVYSTFRTMAQKGLTVGIIAYEMNSALRSLLPDNMMLAAAIMEYSPSEQTLTVWSGGMPAMIIDDGKGNIKELIHPKHPPLAMLEDYEFSQTIDTYSVNEGERAYLFTDGVEESRNKDHDMFGDERLMALFDGNENTFDRIIDALNTFTADAEQDDDITLAELTFTSAPETDDSQETEAINELQHALPWHLNLTLPADKIRKAEPIPQIVKLLNNAVGLNIHQDFISTILSELYNNALEHGLLDLDSSIKQTEDGFLDYYQERSKRLSELENGLITIDVSFEPHATGADVTMMIHDSGGGFKQSDADPTDSNVTFGRGITIIRSLCKSVEYSEGGSTVTAVYSITA